LDILICTKAWRVEHSMHLSKKSKTIIDEIDKVLALHYGFT